MDGLILDIQEKLNNVNKYFKKFDIGNFEFEYLSNSKTLCAEAQEKIKLLNKVSQKKLYTKIVNQKIKEIDKKEKFLEFYDERLHLHIL